MAKKLSSVEQLELENIRLKTEARRFANLINASPNLIWMRDETMKIVYCNLSFAEVAEETTDAVLVELRVDRPGTGSPGPAPPM